jgi:hypothetical protein
MAVCVHRELVTQNGRAVGHLDALAEPRHATRHERDALALLQREQSVVFRGILDEQVRDVDVQDLDAVRSLKGRQPPQVPPSIDDETVAFPRPEFVAVDKADHVDRVAELQPSLRHLPRFPVVGVIGRERLSSLEPEALDDVREQDVSPGPSVRLE